MNIPFSLIEPSAGLTFSELDHKYSYRGEPMVSVTTILKRFSAPFDSQSKAQELSDRLGHKSPAKILAEWSTKRDEAISVGNSVHWEAEQLAWELQECHRLKSSPPQPGKIQSVWSWYLGHFEITQGFLFPELRVCLPNYGIAGTIDLIASNYEGTPSIIDWKTNRRLDVHGYRNMLPPFQRGKLKLPDTSFWTYALQLNLYRRILAERYNYDAEMMVLVHLLDNGSFEEINIPFMDAHVDKILEVTDGLHGQ